MTEDRTVGYSQGEYYSISSKEGLPKRCPILKKCCKAVWTRYVLGFDVVGAKVSFDDFLVSEGQYWEPEKMIKEVEQMRWVEPEKYGGSVFFYAENICPEVTLFEGRYLPTVIVPSAFGDIHYYYESRRTAVKPKHYSECAEFSEYLFHNLGEKKLKGFSHSSSRNQIPENKLEDYLVNNIEALENGLKFVDRQKSIGKWVADIFASDSQGNDVIIELKSKNLNREEIHMLTGQVSKYFNRLKKKAQNLRLMIVLPRSNEDKLDDLHEGLQHWFKENKVTVFQFDYSLYGKEFVFTKVTFEE